MEPRWPDQNKKKERIEPVIPPSALSATIMNPMSLLSDDLPNPYNPIYLSLFIYLSSNITSTCLLIFHQPASPLRNEFFYPLNHNLPLSLFILKISTHRLYSSINYSLALDTTSNLLLLKSTLSHPNPHPTPQPHTPISKILK